MGRSLARWGDRLLDEAIACLDEAITCLDEAITCLDEAITCLDGAIACLDALVRTSHKEKKVNKWSEKLTKAEKPTQE